MANTKFVVKVLRGGAYATQYVQRVYPSPVQMTFNLKRALVMGKFTAEDLVKSMQNSRRIAELVSVQVGVDGIDDIAIRTFATILPGGADLQSGRSRAPVKGDQLVRSMARG